MAFGPFDTYFSQHRVLRARKAAGLHPISELSRFNTLICCFFCSLAVSVTYAFDLFTDTFQTKFGLTPGDMTTVSTVGLVFAYFTMPYSLLFENFGPLTLFCVCIVLSLVGGLGLALTVNGTLPGNTGSLTVFYAILNTASGLIDTAYISTLFEIFPRNRGPVVCLAKVMTGLGSAVLSSLNSNILTDMTDFIYFLMVFCMLVSVWAALVVVLPPWWMNWWRTHGKTEEEILELRITEPYYEQKNIPWPRLILGYAVVVILILFFAIELPVVESMSEVTEATHNALGAVTIILVLCIFLMLLPIPALGGMDEPAPTGDEKNAIEGPFMARYRLEQQRIADNGGALNSATVVNSLKQLNVQPTSAVVLEEEDLGRTKIHTTGSEPTPSLEEAEHSNEKVCRQDPRYEGSFFDYLRNIDLWLILLLFVFYGCMGTLVMYNATTISIAINGHDRNQGTAALYTAFLGVGSSVGRIAFGLFEGFVQHQDPENRKVILTMILPLSPTLAFIAGVLLLTISGDAILLPYLLIYFEEGIFAGVNALIFPSLFVRHHNSLYNLSFLVQCISILCFNRLMFGTYTDRQLKELQDAGLANQNCNVRKCVQVPLIVATCLAFCGIFVAIAIHWRYARYVRRVRALRKKEHEEAEAVPQICCQHPDEHCFPHSLRE